MLDSVCSHFDLVVWISALRSSRPALPALGESWPALDAVGLRGPRLELPPQAGPFDLCALHREAVTRLSAI